MIGIALLGAGRMARVHARAIAAAGAKLVTVFDVIEAAAASLAAETGALAARSVEDTLHHPEVDGVIVVTSSDTHVDCVLQAVEAGKAVMCEKPLAPGLSDAQRYIDFLGTRAGRSFHCLQPAFRSWAFGFEKSY